MLPSLRDSTEPGEGSFYLVRIEAMADPTPPSFSEEDLHRDFKAEIRRLIRQMRDLSEREAIDQVYRSLILYLCNPCYRHGLRIPWNEQLPLGPLSPEQKELFRRHCERSAMHQLESGA